MRRVLIVVVMASFLVTACGSSGSGVTAGGARTLHAEIAKLRAAAERGDRAGTSAEADRLAGLITELRARGDVDASAARRLRAALAAVQDKLILIPLPTTTTTTDPEPERGKGRGNKGGEGNGRGKGSKSDD